MSEHFDLAAKDWDKVDYRHKRARLAAKEILRQVDNPLRKNALEFGCGTGLVSFSMNDKFNSITLLDSSSGMIEEVEEKINNKGITNCESMCFVLENGDQLSINYDVIYSMLAFHHIHDYQKLLALFSENLQPGGKLFIIDLVEEDGSFHSANPDFDGHNGFNLEKLAAELCTAGFSKATHKVFFTIKKEVHGVDKEYPLFIMTGEK